MRGKKERMAEPYLIPMFKNLVRKEAAAKENEMYGSSFFVPTRQCFPEQMNIVSNTEFPWKDVHLFQ